MQTEPLISRLAPFLPSSPQIFVLRDGDPITTKEIAQQSAQLSRRLSEFPPCRVAISTRRVDQTVAALVACEKHGSDLLLLRESLRVEDRVFSDAQISLVLDDDLNVKRVFTRAQAESHGRVMLTTSGTTGAPKIAVHTLEALLGRISRTDPAHIDRERTVRWLLTYHPASYAGLQVILTALVQGSELATTTQLTTTRGLLRSLARDSPTHVSGTPTFWRAALTSGDSVSGSLRQITIGGESVDQGTLDFLRHTFPSARITHIYASTEAGALFAVSDGRAGFPAKWLDDGVDGVQLRIRHDVLEMKSPRAMVGYLGHMGPGPWTDDNWITTTDIVERCGDRVLFKGRLDNVINVGGQKVFPEEVESVLAAMPLVAEVRVYGQPNPISGFLVGAEIVTRAGVDEVLARKAVLAFAQEHLSAAKVPRILKFVSEVSKTASGKKQRS